MLRTVAYLEPATYSKLWQKSVMKCFVETLARIIYANYNYRRDISFLMLSTLWNEYHDFFNAGLIFTPEVFILM